VRLADAVLSDPTVKALCARLASAEETALAANGLWGSAAPVLAALAARQVGRPLLYVTAHFEQADNARDDMETILGRSVELLPAWETLPGEGAAAGEIGAERTRLCAALQGASLVGQGSARLEPRPPGTVSPPGADTPSLALQAGELRGPIIVTPIQAVMQPVPSPAAIDANAMTLAVGQQCSPEQIAAFLLDRGFERLDQVEQPGDYALRGGILDVFATADADPVRIEFFGDQIESIRQFEVGTQRSMRTIQTTRIALPPDPGKAKVAETTSFLNYLPADAIVALDEPLEIAEIGKTILDRLGHPVGHYPVEALVKRLVAFRQLQLSRFPLATVGPSETFTLDCEAVAPFDAKATDAVRQLIALGRRCTVLVLCDNKGEEDRLGELVGQVLAEEAKIEPDATVQPSAALIIPPSIETQIGLIHRGFCWRGTAADDERTPEPRLGALGTGGRPGALGAVGLLVVPHHELFRRYTQKRRIRRVAATRPIETFLDLTEGDYVVHLVHGIGRYVGMKTMRKGDSRKSEEFLTLRFADQATIHVPASQIDLVQKYIGPKGARPPLSKLGGSRWQSTRAKVEEAVTDLAAELLRIQAAREAQDGVPFPQDTHWQTEFENAFLYTETPDQLDTVKEIKADMMRPRPMDRLLCGDVGYGKTELAMRAAFKVVEFGKQVAVLVPTTVLAEQHFRTFRERMADYPFLIECLNRFRPPKQQREIIGGAKKGQIDILIGTHRLLSKDVGFADLGLVVIDEEQRFGVEHKERLKHLRTTVDVLTMTATPIPRTLHMSMIGLRDISSLATPPLDRRSIATRVCSWNDELIREAIVRELNRDGQVYFVHNRVHSIKGVAAKVATLVPDARVLVAHGQMHGDDLEEVMLRFIRHQADILVCTSIIEAGVDIPNVNTIFIDRAELFGLADLHQLRGRVGRYKHRAYCYLLLSPSRPLTDIAARRLKAIEEYSELGAGFQIAMRDLEIRGAGNILGPEQSGHIAAVGYELYCQLLEKAVKRMKGEPHISRVAVHLELDAEAYIPKGYIPSDRQRMECYRRFAACRTPEEVDELARDLQDAFGRPPETVETLLTLADLRVRAAPWGIKAIIKKEPDLIFHIDGEIKKIEPLFADCRGAVSVPDVRTLYWRVPDNYFHGRTLLNVLRNLFRGEPTDIPPPKTPLVVARRSGESDATYRGGRLRPRRT
jgi:transcription-repair coupling factor (superfamily II helicase)